MRYAIVIHGGAGAWEDKDHEAALDGVRAAVLAARDVLAAGGGALDAVVAAVVVLEDHPLFNAGTGSCLNLLGEAEMDAQVMDGETLRAGAVSGIKRVRNPVHVARRVMEETDHVLLAGEGANAFARALGFADHDPVTPEARARWAARRAALSAGEERNLPRLQQLLREHPELGGGTVGACALDVRGRLAAATSTGGVTLKLPGRVGDTPVPGAGNYATQFAAASATGHGELMLRTLATKGVCDRIESGLAAQAAVEHVLREMTETVGGDAGFIAVDRRGSIGVVHGTPKMPFGFLRDGRCGGYRCHVLRTRTNALRLSRSLISRHRGTSP